VKVLVVNKQVLSLRVVVLAGLSSEMVVDKSLEVLVGILVVVVVVAPGK
jgi:hypothetical protein